MSKDRKLKVSVVFDSNLLGGNIGVVANQVSQIAEKSRGNSDFDVKLYASDVVFEEQLDFFNKYFQGKSCSYDELVSFLNKHLNLDLSQIGSLRENQTRKSLEKMWRQNGIKILKTDYRKISVKDLMKEATSKKKPFKGEDKGFKDALILKNFSQNEKIIMSGDSTYTIFACDDKLLKEAFVEKYPNVDIVSDNNELASLINLYFERFGKEQITSITKNAEEAFQNLFANEGIAKKIENEFKNEFIDPEKFPYSGYGVFSTKSYDLKGDFSFFSKGTKFLARKKGDSYRWETLVTVKCLYEVSKTESKFSSSFKAIQDAACSANDVLNSLAQGKTFGIFSEGTPLQTDPVLKQDETKQEEVTFLFKIVWESKLTRDNKLTDVFVKDIKFEGRSFFPSLSGYGV